MDTFTPPQSAKNNARRVLAWRREHGDSVRGMTPVGWARARQLAAGGPVSLDVVKRMAQFARHRKNSAVAPEFRNEPWRDAGHVAWLGWGGSSGIAWASSISSRQKEAGTAVTSVAPHGPGGLFSAPGLGGAANASMGVNGRKRMCKVCRRRKAAAGGICTKCGGLLLQARAKMAQRPIIQSETAVSEKEKFSKASTQFDMPANIRAQALLFANSIDKADLTEDGIETDTHVTIKYGIRPEFLPVVSRIAQDTPPMVLRFGPVTTFTDNKDFDVLKVEVESNELRSLNGRLAALPGSDNTRPFYNPHLTIAYVRKGAGAKYTGAGPLSGQDVTVNQLTFSDPDGNKTAVPLRPSPWQSQAKESFSVFKDAAGDYRWVAISSNSYRDRDQEIVSQAALEADVEYADKTKEYGPLRFWHENGWDIGECDFNMMHGRMLIESGTFKTPAIGAAVAQAQKEYQLSIGFTHPRNEPSDGIYYHIRRFERSLVPSGRAANPFTSLSVKENSMTTKAEKLAEFQRLLGDPEVQSVLKGAESAEKQADDLGISFKETKDLQALAQSDPAALLDYALKNFETAQKADAEDDEEEEKPADAAMKGMDAFMKKMDGYMAKMSEYMSKMGGESKKEADPEPDPVTADATAATKAAQALTNSRVESLETTVKELTGNLKSALKQLEDAREKEAAEPRAFQQGNRPTQETGNVVQKEAKVETNPETAVEPDAEAVKSFDQNMNGFMEFLLPHQQ